MSKHNYIPALRFNWLTPFYDFLINITMPEKKIKQDLITTAQINPISNILDFGCGTATLTMMIKNTHASSTVTGIDIDKQILEKAADKTSKCKTDITLVNYDGDHLPFADQYFDRVLSCLVFHHLNTETKQQVLNELHRVLGKNGQLHIADFGRSDSWFQRLLFNIIRRLDGYKSTDANAKGLMPELISNAGFSNVVINKNYKTVFGEVQLFSAAKNVTLK